MIRILISIALIASLSACINPHRVRVDQGVLIDQSSLESLQTGLTQDQVRRIFGPPSNQSSFSNNRWEYLFRSSDPSFQADKVKLLVIEFDSQGYVTRWTTPNATKS
ncbi:MAG: outer membrane protein assembly factor BamE [Gammaproteobacteria bacterium]|nr:outer membrane protein assembly factor BamE [Gammaproteobacteria bacterium]